MSTTASSNLLALIFLALTALFPFISLMATNAHENLAYGLLALYALGWFASGAMLSLLLSAAIGLKHYYRVVLVVAVLMLCFTGFTEIQTSLLPQTPWLVRISKNLIPLSEWLTGLIQGTDKPARWVTREDLAWLVLTLAVAGATWFISRFARLIRVAIVIIAVMLMVPLSQVAGTFLRGESGPLQSLSVAPQKKTEVAHAERSQLAPQRKPNVYFIILDEYARPDQLDSVLQYDDRPFIQAMARNGFYWAGQSYANYPMTWLSIANTLAMRYVMQPGPNRMKEDRSAFYNRLSGDNETVRQFKAMGYSYIHAEPGIWEVSACQGKAEDHCIRNRPIFGEMESALLRMTPLLDKIETHAPKLYKDLTLPRFVSLQDVIRQLPSGQSGNGLDPFFLFAHINAPHPPYRYQADCSPRTPILENNLHPDAKQAYKDAVSCMNRQVLAMTETILTRDQDPIILIQSDHGSAFLVNWNTPLRQWPEAYFQERFGILNLSRWPKSCGRLPYQAMSPVNTFRLVFACIQGQPPSLLPDVSFMASYKQPEIYARSGRPPGP